MPAMLTLSEARGAINLPASDTTRDSELSAIYIPAAQEKCEEIAGPIFIETRSHTADGGRAGIVLPTAFKEIISITVNGAATTDYTANPEAGIVHAGSRLEVHAFAAGEVVVTYKVGYATATANVTASHKLAARIILAHLWKADQQGNRSSSSQQGETTSPVGFAIPNRALELLRIKPNMPGFA